MTRIVSNNINVFVMSYDQLRRLPLIFSSLRTSAWSELRNSQTETLRLLKVMTF